MMTAMLERELQKATSECRNQDERERLAFKAASAVLPSVTMRSGAGVSVLQFRDDPKVAPVVKTPPPEPKVMEDEEEPFEPTEEELELLKKHGHDPALLARMDEIKTPEDYVRVRKEIAEEKAT